MEKKVVVEEFNKMMDSPMATSVELSIKEIFEDHKSKLSQLSNNMKLERIGKIE